MEEQRRDIELGVLGANVRKHRHEAHLTQVQLGDMTGIRAQHISLIERGERDPRYMTLHKLAEAMELTVSELVQ